MRALTSPLGNKRADGLLRGLVKGIDKVGEILEEDLNIMMMTNVFGLINVRHTASRRFIVSDQRSS